MRIMDEKKRQKILRVAAEPFSAQSFHKVALSDVAEIAAVGKGTIQLCSKNKEDLYVAVQYFGFERVLTRLNERILADEGMASRNGGIIEEYVSSARRSPELSERMRMARIDPAERNKRAPKRTARTKPIGSIIRPGITTGQFADPHPDITARYLLGLVGPAFVVRPEHMERQVLIEPPARFIRRALVRGGDMTN